MDISILYKLRIFSLENVMIAMSVSKSSAAKALLRWQQKGIVQLIRKNMYTAIDPSTNKPLVDKYEVASHVSPGSYVGWHTALEFHGLAHQSFFNAYVGSDTRFNKFRFEDTDFEYCAAMHSDTIDSGIAVPNGNPHVRVTDLERSIVDCCDRLDRSGGAEELLHCLESVVMLDEGKLLQYLNLYNKAFLYQKVGFILERIQNQAHITDQTIELCRKKGALHVKRLTNTSDSDHFVVSWKLYVPDYCLIDKVLSDDII